MSVATRSAIAAAVLLLLVASPAPAQLATQGTLLDLDHGHPTPRLGEPARGDATAESAADDNDLFLCHVL